MKTIHKYPFSITREITIAMPEGAMVIHVECQDGQPCIWAIVDPAKPSVPHRFRIFGTGHPLDDPDATVHVATFQQPPFIWHLFRESGFLEFMRQ